MSIGHNVVFHSDTKTHWDWCFLLWEKRLWPTNFLSISLQSWIIALFFFSFLRGSLMWSVFLLKPPWVWGGYVN